MKGERRLAGDEQLRPDSLQLMVLVGLQASGKTLFIRRHLSAYVHISKDHWPNARHKAARQARVVDEALASGHSVAVDNTNPTLEDRRPLLEAARAHHADPIALVFRATVRECLVRNARRQGRARVPDVAILATAKRLRPPTREERFCCCYEVRLEPDGTFVIRQQPPYDGIQE
jgi:predicted kinase